MQIPKALFFKAFGTRLAGAEGLEVASQPLLRFPKLASGLERRQVLTAAPTNTRFIVRRTRSYVLPRTLRVPSGYFVFIKTKTAPVGTVLFWQGQKDLNPRHAVLEFFF